MKKRIYVMFTFIVVMGLIIGSYVLLNKNEEESLESSKIDVIATLFPQYDFVKQIGKDKVNVTLLLPPAVESHVYEPKPSDIIKISSSDMFVFTGKDMEPWAGTIAESINNINIIDVSENIQLSKEEHNHEEEQEHEDKHEYDPHIWLNPDNAKIMIDNIVEGLSKLDPDYSDFYKQNAEEYKEKINKLDTDIQEVVDNAKRNKLVFGGRFAFAYFIEKYDLEYIGAYNSCSTETEPSVAVIANVIQEVKKDNIPVIFYEEFSAHAVADSIASQTGAKTLLFHSVHNVTKDDLENEVTYVDVMRQNLDNLKIALN